MYEVCRKRIWKLGFPAAYDETSKICGTQDESLWPPKLELAQTCCHVPLPSLASR